MSKLYTARKSDGRVVSCIYADNLEQARLIVRDELALNCLHSVLENWLLDGELVRCEDRVEIEECQSCHAAPVLVGEECVDSNGFVRCPDCGSQRHRQ